MIEWGKTHGTVFSAHLSDDGENFREMGRIATGNGDSDSFWWRSTTGRYFRLTVHEASAPAGAIVNELKLRILNKDRMPIGQLERAALAGRGELYPQSLLGRQIYWTALGEYDRPRRRCSTNTAISSRGANPRRSRLCFAWTARCTGAREPVDQPVPGRRLAAHSDRRRGLRAIMSSATALAHAGAGCVEHRIVNRSARRRSIALVLAVRPVQINPYWQHGGHAAINAIAVERPRRCGSNRPAIRRVFGSTPTPWPSPTSTTAT